MSKMSEAARKRMELSFYKWWTIVGGSIHGIWKRRQWSALMEFAKNAPRIGYETGYQSGFSDPHANKEMLNMAIKYVENLRHPKAKTIDMETYNKAIHDAVNRLKTIREARK